MKKQLLLFISMLFCFAPSLFAIAADSIKAPDWGREELVEEYTLGPGIKYQKYIYPDKPLIIWFTEIDLTNPLNQVEQVQSRNQVPDTQRWLTDSFYKEMTWENHKVRAAWNHDFFNYGTGRCIGINISYGEMTGTTWGRSLLAITKDRKAEIFKPDQMVNKVIAPDGTEVIIDGYNTQAYGDCVFHNRLSVETQTREGRYIQIEPQAEFTINGADVPCKVLAISDSPIQPSRTNLVIFVTGNKKTALEGHLKVNDVLKISQKFTGAGWGTPPADIVAGFHGYPSLVRNGEFHDGEYNDFENGREYEGSAHNLVGLSADKTKLYVAINEMSYRSQMIDCVELASWMVLRGANDIVNFDSGGSTALSIDEGMVNLPGRGSLRPVQDALLAVSLTPEDSVPHHLAFSKPKIEPSIISLTPLRVLLFNKYDEAIDKNLEGCTFRCEPAELGYVDENAILHTSGKSMSGFVIASKDGLECKVPVTTRPATDIIPKYTNILTDTHRKWLVEINAKVGADILALDAMAFNWTSTDPDVCTVEDGLLIGKKEGKAVITGTFESMTFDINVTVEEAKAPIEIYDLKDISKLNIKCSGIKNLTSSTEGIPAGWNEGNVLNFDLNKTRSVYIKLADEKILYSVPDSISIVADNSNEYIKSVTFMCKDSQNENLKKVINCTNSENDTYTFNFADEETKVPFNVGLFPIKVLSVQFMMNNKASVKDAKLPVKYIRAFYPEYSSVEGIISDKTATDLSVILGDETATLRCNAEKEEKATLTMFSTSGCIISEQAVTIEKGQNEFVIDTKSAVPGIYIVSLNTAKDSSVAKCIIR